MCVCRTSASSRGRADVTCSRPAHGDKIERALEAAAAQGEVARGDGGREAVVEAAGDPELRVHVVPAQALDRELVRAQLACMEQPEDLDAREVVCAQRAELLDAVLADVPR